MTLLDQTLALPALNSARGACEFLGTDSEELFQLNSQRRGPGWPWHTQRVVYHLNSEGYRAPEWSLCDWSKGWVLFGCSWAFGIGVSEDQTLGHYLSDQLRQPVINVSQGGSSIRWTCDQLTQLLRQGCEITRICVVWTEVSRWPFWGGAGPDQPWLSQNLYRAHAADPQHCDTRALLDVWEFREQCRGRGIQLVECSWNQHTSLLLGVTLLPRGDLARDGQHPGPSTHRASARIIQALL